MSSISTIPLDEISPGACIRLIELKGIHHLSTRDIIMHVCGKDLNHAAEIWRRLDVDRKKEVEPISMFQFPGRGQSKQPVVTLPSAIKLVMALPGHQATAYRIKFAEIISRYLNGDVSLSKEINYHSLIGQKRSYTAFIQDTMRDVQETMVSQTPISQYIYATKSVAFPGLLKIGRTTNMKTRLSQLNISCAPAPHVLVAIVPTLNMERDEYLVHDHFAAQRKRGEFFHVSESEIKQYFTDVILQRYQKELLESMQS